MHPNAERRVRQTAWYIESRLTKDPNETPICGSAVCIQLKPSKTDQPKKYLLTCAHVVYSRNNSCWLPEIVCWPPERGYSAMVYRATWPLTNDSRDGVFLARINNQLSRKSFDETGVLSEDIQVQSPAVDFLDEAQQDWVILEVLDPRFQAYPSVGLANRVDQVTKRRKTNFRLKGSLNRESCEQPLVNHKTEFEQVREFVWTTGYPGGDAEWDEGARVQCTVLGKFKCGIVFGLPGMLKVDGALAAPGMSGGGLFTFRGGLVGIHRSSNDKVLAKGALNIATIDEGLRLSGYEIVAGSPVRGLFWPAPLIGIPKPVVWKITSFLASICLVLSLIIVLLIFSPGPKPPPDFASYEEFQSSFRELAPGSRAWRLHAQETFGAKIGGWDLWVYGINEKRGYECGGAREHMPGYKLSVFVIPPRGLMKIGDRTKVKKLTCVNGILEFEDGIFFLRATHCKELLALGLEEYLQIVKGSRHEGEKLRSQFKDTQVKWRGYCRDSNRQDGKNEYFLTSSPGKPDFSHAVRVVSDTPLEEEVLLEISGTIKALTMRGTTVRVNSF